MIQSVVLDDVEIYMSSPLESHHDGHHDMIDQKEATLKSPVPMLFQRASFLLLRNLRRATFSVAFGAPNR